MLEAERVADLVDALFEQALEQSVLVGAGRRSIPSATAGARRPRQRWVSLDDPKTNWCEVL